MKYFLTEHEREQTGSTCYHEFYKGKWDEETMLFWSEDSLYIHDNQMFDLKLDELICSIVNTYDPFGETEIDKTQWNAIKSKAEMIGDNLLDAINELTPWVEDTYVTHNIFTILGI
jgi:hypothetical protein